MKEPFSGRSQRRKLVGEEEEGTEAQREPPHHFRGVGFVRADAAGRWAPSRGHWIRWAGGYRGRSREKILSGQKSDCRGLRPPFSALAVPCSRFWRFKTKGISDFKPKMYWTGISGKEAWTIVTFSEISGYTGHLAVRPDSLGSKWNVRTGGGRNIVHFLKNSDREKKTLIWEDERQVELMGNWIEGKFLCFCIFSWRNWARLRESIG